MRTAVILTLGGIVGCALILAGAWLVYPPVALILAGIPLVLAGAYGLLRVDVG